jgi:hypothetical protein
MFVVIPRQMADLGEVKFVLAHDERRGPARKTRAASRRSQLSTTSRARRTLLGVVPNLDADPALASTTVGSRGSARPIGDCVPHTGREQRPTFA